MFRHRAPAGDPDHGVSSIPDINPESENGVVVNPDVDAYLERSERWPDEMAGLRTVLLNCGLVEEIKWGKPCYSHQDRNIVILQEMKDFLALMFFKGTLLNDPERVLEDQGPNSAFGPPHSIHVGRRRGPTS